MWPGSPGMPGNSYRAACRACPARWRRTVCSEQSAARRQLARVLPAMLHHRHHPARCWEPQTQSFPSGSPSRCGRNGASIQTNLGILRSAATDMAHRDWRRLQPAPSPSLSLSANPRLGHQSVGWLYSRPGKIEYSRICRHWADQAVTRRIAAPPGDRLCTPSVVVDDQGSARVFLVGICDPSPLPKVVGYIFRCVLVASHTHLSRATHFCRSTEPDLVASDPSVCQQSASFI